MLQMLIWPLQQNLSKKLEIFPNSSVMSTVLLIEFFNSSRWKRIIITIETLVLIVKQILRNYPHQSHDCTAVVANISDRNVLEPKDKIAVD